MLNTKNRILIRGMGAYGLQAIMESAAIDHYQGLSDSDNDGLLLEQVTLEEVEHTYLQGGEVSQGESAMFEAISTQRQQLAQTMRAFTRVLNGGLNGTDISGGVENAPDDSDGNGAGGGNVIGGAIIGKVRKIAGIPVIAAKIPLSDGQSISILFHSPTSNGKTIIAGDLLVAFQFLLNKRDVTHTVAPIGGKDVTLAQVAQVLANLIEKNSGKFQKQKAVQQQTKQATAALQAEADKLEQQRSDVLNQLTTVQDQETQTQQQVDALNKQVSEQQAINKKLKAKLAKLKKNQPAPPDTSSQNPTQPEPTDKGQATTDNPDDTKPAEPADKPDTTEAPAAGYRYALFNRPAGVGAIPPGQSEILPKPDSSDPYSKYARHGIVVYPQRLTDEQAAQFELVYLPTHAEYSQYATKLAQGPLEDYAQSYIGLAKEDNATFIKTMAMQFKKAFPDVAYPQGDDVNFFLTDVLSALTGVAGDGGEQPPEQKQDPEPQPEPQPQPEPEPEKDDQEMAIDNVAALTGKSADSVANWWSVHGTGPSDLLTISSALSAAPTQGNIEALNSAIDFGTAFTASGITANAATTTATAAGTDGSDDNVHPEADKAAEAAIDALKEMLNFSSHDLDQIQAKLDAAQDAGNALIAAGKYDENEGLVDQVADKLIGLLNDIYQQNLQGGA